MNSAAGHGLKWQLVFVFQSKTPITSPVAAQTQCDLFINEAGEDVSHLNISFEANVCERMKNEAALQFFLFLLGGGGQAEESKQDANNYYANHLWHHESRTQEPSNPPKCQSNVRSPPSVWISTGCQKASG